MNFYASIRMNWYEMAFDIYKKARSRMVPCSFSRLRCPTQTGLVSIVLPVYNGADMLRESIDSILAQTYSNFELISIDDGSTDNSGEILDEYASQDSRIHVFHQENQKLPRTLSRGFSLAQGEFLTWTSHDNRMKKEFLEKLVNCLNRHPRWNMVYANLDIIGENGEPLVDSEWYRGYQRPPGSNHIFLPHNEGSLNTLPNNYIGAGFLYRDHVSFLLGDYSQDRFTFEDYDYWMQVNSLLNLHHADFDDPIYEYRFHTQSLTSREKELGITARRNKLFAFDSFRRDFYLSPLVWMLDTRLLEGKLKSKANKLEEAIQAKKHILLPLGKYLPEDLPLLWMPCAYVYFTNHSADALPDENQLPQNALRILVSLEDGELPVAVSDKWDICINWGEVSHLPRLSGHYQGWLSTSDLETLIAVIDVRTRTEHIRQIERAITAQEESGYKISIVISTFRRSNALRDALLSLAEQTLPSDEYQVIVVNNDPEDQETNNLVKQIRAEVYEGNEHRLKLVLCPIPGLSTARNAGIAAATGKYVGFFDDDAVASPDWLEKIYTAFMEHLKFGLIGGTILLQSPKPRPRILKPGWEVLWGNFEPRYPGFTLIKEWYEYPWGSNWFAPRQLMMEIGGFRSQFGRKKDDFGGGEEVAAAGIIQKLGFDIGIEPSAVVFHRPSADRFTFKQAWRTNLQGTLTTYRIQKNLYLTYVEIIPGNLRQIFYTFLRGLKYLLPSQWQPWKALLHLMKTASAFVLLFEQIEDYFYRFRKPFVLKEPKNP